MSEQIFNFFTLEMIYLWLNLGVLPFWIILIFFSNSNICKILVTSIFPILIISFAYCYLIYYVFINSYDFLLNFKLYLGLSEIEKLFSDRLFLILFWTHFLGINLFCGGWIVNDYKKIGISKILVALPLLTTYLVGPLGILIYWIIRIFYAKRLGLYE